MSQTKTNHPEKSQQKVQRTCNNARRVLIFDTETTGIIQYDGPRRIVPYIVQLAFIGYDTVSDTFEYMEDIIVRIDDHIELPIEAVNVHGITRDIMKEKGVSITNALTKFKEAMEWCDCIVAHNINFDKTVVLKEARRNNINLNFDWNGRYERVIEYCTMKRGRNITKIIRYNEKTEEEYYKNPKMIELYEHFFDGNVEGLHNAFADILLCLRCYIMMTRNIDIRKHSREIRACFRKYCLVTNDY